VDMSFSPCSDTITCSTILIEGRVSGSGKQHRGPKCRRSFIFVLSSGDTAICSAPNSTARKGFAVLICKNTLSAMFSGTRVKRNLLAGLVLMLSVGTLLNTCEGCAKRSCDCFGRHPAPRLHFASEQQATEVTVYTKFWICPAGLRAKETFSALYYTSSDVLNCSADGNTGQVKLVF
jgi:hypothetical protein